MGTINTAFSIISGALDADQSALSIIAGNVANANTPGYTTEVANWQENQPFTVNGANFGDGVTETGATSLRDRVLEGRLDQQQQLAASSGTRLTALDSLQALFTPDSGTTAGTAGDIGNDITTFFSSFSSLEADPTSVPLREEVLSSATTLAGDISNAAASMNAQSASLSQDASGVTSQVNSLTTAIAGLNQQIQTTSPNADAGTLEDQRQQDLSQLSQLIGINQITTENNGLSVTTTSGQVLVSENTSFQLTSGTVSGAAHFFIGNQDVTSQLASGGGQLGGTLTARDQDIPTAMSALDQMAYSVSTSINALNNSGTDLGGIEGTGTNAAGVTGNGAAPLYLFNQPTQVAGSALNMHVIMTDPTQIAAAKLGAGSGDNTNAAAMANLDSQSLIQPTASTIFSVVENLNSSTPVNGTVTGNVTLYDSLGTSYDAAITYTNQGSNTWTYAIALPETLQADTSVANQVSYTFGSGETVDPGTNLTITGTSGGGTATIVAPTITPGEAVGSAGPPPTGYVASLDAALTAAGITGVTVTNAGGVLTIAGAAATAGTVVADAGASSGATGSLTFNASGALITPAANTSGITFSGLTNGAAPLSLTWDLYGSGSASNITQTTAASAQTSSTQNGSAGVNNGQTPSDFYSSFVSTLGATVSGVQDENTAQNASVTQLQTQNNALSGVNLNDEASAMSTMENSYQAAAQVFNLLNTIMTSALNLGEETTVT
jgi:flagellar hook-associated protein 1 FlgK